ncbi:MAG: hypothetical protein Q9M92_02255 [Enterobacterales bacterium]|nr:hypothetical protein [Enterobacterales bacterium]
MSNARIPVHFDDNQEEKGKGINGAKIGIKSFHLGIKQKTPNGLQEKFRNSVGKFTFPE